MDMKKFYAKCLQGNVIEAIDYLKSFENKSEDILELERKYVHRFVTQDEVFKIDSEDSWIQEVVKCYFDYFSSVLTDYSQEEAQKHLIMKLAKLVNINYDSELDEIEEELEKIFNEKGYSFLGGITMPFRSPYIWKTTLRKDFNVELIDGKQDVTVYFISDFLILGWAHFATLGKHYAGGWANKEGLYYVDDGSECIDIDSTEFQISYLKHEAQHLSDFEKYSKLNPSTSNPDFDQSILEYRAKLTEIYSHPQPFVLIEKFLYESKNDKTLPHSYASYLVIKHLSNLIFGKEYVQDKEQWKDVKQDVISNAVYILFSENNVNLNKWK